MSEDISSGNIYLNRTELSYSTQSGRKLDEICIYKKQTEMMD
jgi:hypothetical protein